MNPKHILITILFLIFCLNCTAQNNTDTITIVKNGFETEYLQGNMKLSLNQLLTITKEDKLSYTFVKKANTLHTASIAFSTVGGICIGFSLGYVVGRTIMGNIVNLKVLLPALGIGSAFVVSGVLCQSSSNKNIQYGILVFNKSLIQKNNTSINLGFSPTEINLKLNF